MEILSPRLLRNPTPKQVVLLISIPVAVISALSTLLICLVFELSLWWLFIPVALFTYAGVYHISFYFLGIYVFRKQKMIYKTIHQTKLALDAKEEIYFSDEPLFDRTTKEVVQWAQTEGKEISRIKSWREYRRKFLGDISHELKTPIFNVQGYIESLLDGALDDREVAASFLSKASKNLDRLNTIVQDLESISQLESDQLILDMQVFDIKELCKEVFDDLELKAHEKDISLVFKAGADAPCKVRADIEYIRQALMNLLNNSIKYGRKGGTTKVSFYDMDSYLLIEVSDNGIGISKEHIPHLFDRFYRVDKSRSREQGGSGLGLSIVKHIIEAHKQVLNVRSNPGVGSTFGFTLEKVV